MATSGNNGTGKRPFRRSPRRRPNVTGVVVPYADAVGVPGWSAGTHDRLSRLTALEQRFVQHLAAGDSAARAYRRAAGKDSPAAKQVAWVMRQRPDVQLALAACVRDANATNRRDRVRMLAKLMAAVEITSSYTDPASQERASRVVMRLARLTGLIPDQAAPGGEADGGFYADDVRDRLDRLLASARAYTRGTRDGAPQSGPPGITDRPTAEGVPGPGGAGAGGLREGG